MAVLVVEEAGLTIVSPLHDVQGKTVEMDTRAAGHGLAYPKLSVAPFPSAISRLRTLRRLKPGDIVR